MVSRFKHTLEPIVNGGEIGGEIKGEHGGGIGGENGGDNGGEIYSIGGVCREVNNTVMSTSAYVDSETITQADKAQSSRVPVPLPDDPYIAVRLAHLVDTDTELDPEEAPSEAKELQSLGSRVPLMGEEFEAFETIGTRTDLSHSSA
ncbi:hypothetical protein Tco_0060919 [Tanacetum coccineum]